MSGDVKCSVAIIPFISYAYCNKNMTTAMGCIGVHIKRQLKYHFT